MSMVFGCGVYLVQHDGGCLGEPVRRNHVDHTVVLKLLADVLRIRLADRQAGIVVRIGLRRRRIIDIDAALAEVARGFGSGGHRVDHRHGLDIAQAFVVHEEERLAGVPDRAANRRAEVVLHQEI